MQPMFHARVHVYALTLITVAGCTSESTRIAIQAQQRANEVDQAVFDNQHDSLLVLSYRDAVSNVVAAAPPRDADDPASPPIAFSAGQRTALSNAWNQRDLFEFWRIQHERAKALRLIGVDAKLYGDQSIIDLLYKSLDAKVRRAESAKPAVDPNNAE